MGQLITRIEDELHDRLRAQAAAEGRSMNAVVVEALTAAVAPLDARGRLRARLLVEGMLYEPPIPAHEVPSHQEVLSATKGSGTAVSEALAAERAAH
jgi:plasmid stability protein